MPPFNGSGVFTTYTPGNPVVNGTVISSTVANNTNSDFATGLSTALTKDGQTTVTANIPFAGFRLTGVGAASARTDAAQYAQVQNSAATLLGTVAGTNTITATLTPALTAYASGQIFTLVPANTITGAATLNIDGVGAKNIFAGGVALKGGELRQSVPVQVEYDGTQFNILGSVGGTTFTPTISFGGSSTGVTYTVQSGVYRVIPGLGIWFKISITLSSNGSGSGVALITLTGLPSQNNDFATPVSVRLAGSLGASVALAQGYVNANTATVSLERQAGGTTTTLTEADLGDTAQISISGIYNT